jgi:tetratricopeptide (TPR) repeat protein
MRTIIVALLVLGHVASAQPTAGDRAKAASHFKQGQLYFKDADYDRALAEYEAAYALSPEPLLIFNIALCHDRAQRPEKALENFRRYLDLAPNGQVADEAREDVARLTRVVDAIVAKRTEEERATAEQRAAREAEAARKADEERRAREAATAADSARRAREASAIERRARIERWAAYGSFVVGAAGIGIGIKYGLDARSDANALGDHTMGAWTDELVTQDDQGRSANTKMIVFTSIGSAFVVGGGALLLLSSHTHAHAESLRVGVVPDPHGPALSVSGRF